MTYRFGRLPHSPEVFSAAPRHLFGAVLPPPVVDRRSVSYIPGLYFNDSLPDCSAVGLVNAARAVSALNGFELNIDPVKIPQFYASVVGCPSDFPSIAKTEGAILIDVLSKQERTGFNIGNDLLVAAWGTIDPTSRSDLALAISKFGSVYIGVSLRERDMETVGHTWSIQPGRDDGNVVGGHCVTIFDYLGLSDSSTVRIGTWGILQTATWEWVQNRIDESYGLVWRQLAKAESGLFWNGLTADTLFAQLD